MSNPFGRLATAKAALLMTGSTYVSFFFGLVVSALIARAIGPAEFGKYAFVVWMSGLLVQIANNGLNTTGIRFISEGLGRGQAESANQVHGWLLKRQLWCLLATAAGFLVTLPWTLPASWNANYVVFGTVVLVSTIAKAMYLFDVSVAKGHAQFSVEAYSNMSISAINMVAVAVLYFLNASLTAYLILFAATSAAYGLITWRMLRARKIRPSSVPLDAELAPRLRKHLVWTVVLTVAAALGNKASETYLLSIFASPADLGFFAIAASLTRGGVELLSAGLNTVLMPLMGHAYGAGGKERVNAILSDSVRFFGFAGLLLCGVGVMWADVAVTLMYGAQYQPATLVFQVMVLVAGITLSQGAFGALLSTTDHQRVRAYVAALSVALSAIAAVLLVPHYGLMGAVVAHAVSSAVIFILVGVGIVRVFAVSLPWRELGRLVFAAAIAATAMAGCRAFGSSLVIEFIAGLVYALVFILSTFVVKAWKTSDLQSMLLVAERYPRLLGPLLSKLVSWATP
jgi:O-antigen/teichoic acid export membrane protein